MDRFDIVIAVGPRDKDILEKQLSYTRKNIIGYRKIFLVCADPNIRMEGCTTIDEKSYPFTIDTVDKLHGKTDSNGWYLQQLLKLYAGTVISGILNRYLVIDCDTFFLRPVRFIEDGKCLYMHGSEYHKPYFDHMRRLNPNLTKIVRQSGICHHMMFETNYVTELIKRVEEELKDTFYNSFLKLVSDEWKGKPGGASEYELYFNYMLKFHTDKIKYRELKWCNWEKDKGNGPPYDFISYHWYTREKIEESIENTR